MPALTPRRAATLLALGTLALATTAPAQDPFQRYEGPARAAAESWVQMLDDGHYEDAWEATSPLFKEGLSKLDWMRKQKDRAEERGPLSGRGFMTGNYMHSLRHPRSDVEFVAESLVYGSADKGKNRWIEVMLMVREKGKEDGPWTILDYDCRPRPLDPALGPG